MSTIKTFGPVDTRNLKQLERCMEAGDAAFGVLCADHHPGYSQPVGGGIAYEGFVSPSGVGYDIVLVGGGADEAPEVYRRLPDVLAAHGETIRVKHTLRPLGVAMAGRDVYDPHKD